MNLFDLPNPENQRPNPFGTQDMIFEINAIHAQTGSTKEGFMKVDLPVNATELQARKMILDMGYTHGWSFKVLKRISNNELPSFPF